MSKKEEKILCPRCAFWDIQVGDTPTQDMISYADDLQDEKGLDFFCPHCDLEIQM